MRTGVKFGVLAVLLAVIMGAAPLSFPSSATDGGRATIMIYDVYGLQNMSLDLNASYALAKDIDASQTATWNAGAGFAPVGNDHPVGYSARSFAGSFDGRGCTITGLYMNHPGKNYIGLFGSAGAGSIISNLTLRDLYVSANMTVGGLAGESFGTIFDCHVNGSVIANNYVGGLVAHFYTGTITNCSFDGWVMEYNSYSGGLVGVNEGGNIIDSRCSGSSKSCQVGGGLVGENRGSIINCHTNWTISGGSAVGGLVGHNFGPVTRCYSTGAVEGRSMGPAGGIAGSASANIMCSFYSGSVYGEYYDAGGLVGELGLAATIKDCFAMGAVKGDNAVPAGGLVGSGMGTIVNCYSISVVAPTGSPGGLTGHKINKITSSYWDRQASGINVSGGGTGLSTAEMMEKASFAGWDFDLTWDILEGVTYPFLRGLSPEPGNNTPPSILTSPVETATQDVPYAVQYQASDPDSNDNLTWGLNTDARWLTMDPATGLLSGIPTASDLGSHDIVITVSDGRGGVGRQFFRLIVAPFNHPPQWSRVPADVTLSPGGSFRFNASATDIDFNSSLNYGLTSVPVCNMTIDPSEGTLQWSNVTEGAFEFNLSATDGVNTIWHIFNLTVNGRPKPSPVPEIIVVTGPENVTVGANSVQTFSVEAASPSNSPLTYEWKDNGVTVSTERSFSRTFAPGNHTLILLIGDGRYTTTRTFNFTVAPPPKNIDTKPVSAPGFEAGIAALAVVTAVAIGLFWRRERR